MLGCDEEHLWQAFRWLGLSVDEMGADEAAEWERAEGIRSEEVLEVTGRGTRHVVERTLRDGVAYISGTACSLRMLSRRSHSAHCDECDRVLSILRLQADPEI